MADYVKVDGVAAADIVKVDGVAVADIVKVDGATKPASGATRWVVVMDDAFVGYAENSDRTSWTMYDHLTGTGTQGSSDIAFGKDGSGNGIYVASRMTTTKEILISGTDVTTVADWTVLNLSGSSNEIYTILWGADTGASADGTWVAAGQQNAEVINRSVDGAQNWVTTDLSGLTGHVDNVGIQGMASNGAGTWAFGQNDRFYISTDDAASFAVSTPWAGDNPPGQFRGIAYTNNSWVIVYTRGSVVRYRSCAASDITDWGAEETASNMKVPSNTGLDRVFITAANGRVCIVSRADKDPNYFDVNGKTISNAGTVSVTGMSAEDISTDGSTWLIPSRGGDIWESTNNGEAWSEIATNIGTGTSAGDDAQGICCDVVLPL